MAGEFLRAKDLLSLSPLSGEELAELLDLAIYLKEQGTRGLDTLRGKSIALLFEKPSMRTSVSFEVAVVRLGGHPLVLDNDKVQLGERESVHDVAKVLSSFIDGLVMRTFGQDRLESFAEAAYVPVINALTDQCHPCQALADMLTILETKKTFKGQKLAYLGDGNNVTHSLMRAGSKLGMDLAIAAPAGREPDPDIVAECKAEAAKYGGSLEIGNDPVVAASGADIIYTDVWVSMGAEPQSEAQLFEVYGEFQVNPRLLRMAGKDCVVMHCLPAHRGMEITDEVIDGEHSAVWSQAENRLHAQTALLHAIYG